MTHCSTIERGEEAADTCQVSVGWSSRGQSDFWLDHPAPSRMSGNKHNVVSRSVYVISLTATSNK